MVLKVPYDRVGLIYTKNSTKNNVGTYQRKLRVHFDGLGVLVECAKAALIDWHVHMFTTPASGKGFVFIRIRWLRLI